VRPDTALFILAAAAETGIAATDVMLSRHVILIGLLIAGPLLAAATLDLRRCVAIAGFAMALTIGLSASDHIFGTADGYAQFLVVAVGVGFAIPSSYARSQREAAFRRVTTIAEVAQRAVLPALPANVSGVDFAYRYRSATRDASLGGDFYDVVLTPTGVRLVVGDVRGNGLSAVGLSAAVLRAFRENVCTAVSLVELARYLDARLSDELGIEDFVTVVLAEFAQGEVRLVNCGHHSPLRIGLRLEKLIPPHRSPPIGLSPDPILQRARLCDGERILFYTDGLAEARNANGEMFRMEDRIADMLTAPLLEDAVEGLFQLALNHTGGEFRDDLTLVLAQPSEDRDTLSHSYFLPGQAREPRQEKGEDPAGKSGG
jgi:sigma-B regulation protein RsbU (phosphoserine phosphatase)